MRAVQSSRALEVLMSDGSRVGEVWESEGEGEEWEVLPAWQHAPACAWLTPLWLHKWPRISPGADRPHVHVHTLFNKQHTLIQNFVFPGTALQCRQISTWALSLVVCFCLLLLLLMCAGSSRVAPDAVDAAVHYCSLSNATGQGLSWAIATASQCVRKSQMLCFVFFFGGEPLWFGRLVWSWRLKSFMFPWFP